MYGEVIWTRFLGGCLTACSDGDIFLTLAFIFFPFQNHLGDNHETL